MAGSGGGEAVHCPAAVNMDIVLLDVFHHMDVAVAVFFALLKEQDHPTFNQVLMCLQHLGCAHQHSGMGIVTAQMGNTGNFTQTCLGLRPVAGVLFDRQSVNVSPEEYGFTGYIAFDKCHNAAAGHIHKSDPGFGQNLTNQRQGFVFIVRKLRMLVDLSAPSNHFIFNFRCPLQNIHKHTPFCKLGIL